MQRVKSVSITLTPKLAREIRVRAAQQGKSRSQYIAEVMARELARPSTEEGEQ